MTPAIDLNYGLGEHVQLTLQTANVILQRSGHGLIDGLGSTEAAVKWRFLDEERYGFAMSTFPRIIFNMLQSSVRRRGLANDGTRVQTPVQIARKDRIDRARWRIRTACQDRSDAASGSTESWADSLRDKTTSLMAELHGTSRSNFSRDVLTVNFGLRQKLTDYGSLHHFVRPRRARA